MGELELHLEKKIEQREMKAKIQSWKNKKLPSENSESP